MIAWERVETVLLDMDGTLLDLHFDNHFWREHVPRRFAESRGLDPEGARAQVYAHYRRVEGTLDWYCVDYWTRTLGLDIAALKRELVHLIAPHPHTAEFLAAARGRGRRLVLVTNAHTKSLALKLAHTRLDAHFDAVVCAHDLGLPKEHPAFWERLRAREPYEPAAALLIDDSLPVLRTARAAGIGQVLAVSRPDSRHPAGTIEEFPAVADLREVLPA